MAYQHDENTEYNDFDDLELTADILKNYNNYLAKIIFNNINSKAIDILDFGAGTGTLISLLKSKSDLLNIDAIELDLNHQQILKNKGIIAYGDIKEVSKLYDVVYSSNVLEHIEDDLQAMVDIHKVIKPQGQFILYLPALNLLRTSWDDKIGHYRRYSKHDLITKLTQAGFSIDKISYIDSIGGVLALIYKYKPKSADHNPLKANLKELKFYDRVLFKLNVISDLFLNPFFGKNVFVVATKK